jgi:hypothetical protein
MFGISAFDHHEILMAGQPRVLSLHRGHIAFFAFVMESITL